MRLILVNPHIHQFGTTVAHFLIRRTAVMKYTYVLDYIIKNPAREVAFLIDGTRSSFNELGFHCRFWPQFWVYGELKMWLIIHGVNPFRHRVYFSVHDLDSEKDVIFNYSFTTLDTFSRNNNALQFHEYVGRTVHHLTHYFCGTRTLSAYTARIPRSFFVAENNLARNSFFKHYFPAVYEVGIIPFAYAERFQNRVPFKNRASRCFAIGTVSRPRYREFIDFYGEGFALHPLRQELYVQQEKLKDIIDCFIQSYDGMRNIKQIDPRDSFLTRRMRRLLPSFLLEKFVPNYMKQYFNYDIVQKYNEYQMFVSPEEIIGLPSVNFVEGMASGCAFFGIDDPMYRDIGLLPGIHYVAYADLNDLQEKIRWYVAHQDALAIIAEAGCAVVREHFSRRRVADYFWHHLESL